MMNRYVSLAVQNLSLSVRNCCRLLLDGASFCGTVVVPRAYVHHHREKINLMRFFGVVRSNRRKPNRHMNHLFRKARGRKFIRPVLPDMELMRKQQSMTLEELRSALKKQGVPAGGRNYNERPMLVSCSNEIFEPFQPLEGEGKMSPSTGASVKGAMKKLNLWQSYQDRKAMNKIKKHDEHWTVESFEDTAEEIYIAAHEALQNRDSDRLHDLVTEKAYAEMWKELHLRSIMWRYVDNLEKPKVVRVRVAAQLDKSNEYAQVTVRLHSKQILAIYDQFGRILLGSETVEVPVLEYVVFENHIVNQYGSWRLHGKILPPSFKQRPVLRTFKIREVGEKYDVPDQVDSWITDEEDQKTAVKKTE